MEIDRLSAESSMALAAGMSYGKWKAMQNPVKIIPTPKPNEMKCICELCGKEFIQYDRRARKYCSTSCKNAIAYERKKERIQNGKAENVRDEQDIHSEFQSRQQTEEALHGRTEERKDEEMKMKVMLDPGAKMPARAHETDAGLDLYATKDKEVPAFGSAVFDTGVHVEIPAGYVGMIKSKSGLNVNHGITSEGVIDAGYVGSMVVKLYNNSMNAVQVKAGQKISQLVILPIITPELELVDSLEDTERGTGGFGSTGAF